MKKKADKHKVLLVPTYGRSYLSREEMLADWSKGTDFRIVVEETLYQGPYCSIRDLERMRKEFATITLAFRSIRVVV